MKKRETVINTISSILLQVVTIISGFIIPRLLLGKFGSEVNGLISSLNQFLNYITLLEGGLGAVILANLYKPLVEKDEEKISSVVITTQKLYQKLSIIFLVYTLILGIVYPFIVNTSFSMDYIFSLTLILSINMFVQYCFSITWRTLLKADKKVYYVSFVQILVIVLNIIGVVIVINIIPNVHIVKLVTAMVYLLQPVLFHYYVKKHYKIDKKAKIDKQSIKQRWSGFGINIAAFIHNNTDMVVLSIFSDLKSVSIYSVYYLVTTGLKNIITSISGGIVPTIGHIYASGDKEKLNKAFDAYEFITFYVTFILFVVGGILIAPFVLLYTKGINDANYNRPLLGIFMILSEMIFCLREPYVNMAYSANKFKDISKYAYIEAALNIVLSIILVFNFGIEGVAIATFIAMLYRTICQIIYLKKNVLYRNIGIVIKKAVVFAIATAIIVIISKLFMMIGEISVISWTIYAIKNTLLAVVVYTIFSLIFFKEQIIGVMKKFKLVKNKKEEENGARKWQKA